MLVLIVILSCEIVMLKCQIYEGSVIFRNGYINNTESIHVKRLCITHSKIPGSPINLFSDNLYSHWTLGIQSTDNEFYLVSPTANKSVNVHHILSHNKPQSIDNTHLTFKDGNNYIYIINKNEIYKPIYSLTLAEIITDALELNKTVNYNLMTFNCHYQIKHLISMYCNVSFNDNINRWSLFKNVLYETLGNANNNLFVGSLQYNN